MFGEPVDSIDDIKEAVATYTSRAAEKLRRQNSAASVVSVFIVAKEQDHNIDFRHGGNIGTYATLPAATSITNELIKPAVQLIDRLYKRGTGIKSGCYAEWNSARQICTSKYVSLRKKKQRSYADGYD